MCYVCINLSSVYLSVCLPIIYLSTYVCFFWLMSWKEEFKMPLDVIMFFYFGRAGLPYVPSNINILWGNNPSPSWTYVILGLQECQLNRVDQLSTIKHSGACIIFQFPAHQPAMNMIRKNSFSLSLLPPPSTPLWLYKVTYIKSILWDINISCILCNKIFKNSD